MNEVVCDKCGKQVNPFNVVHWISEDDKGEIIMKSYCEKCFNALSMRCVMNESEKRLQKERFIDTHIKNLKAEEFKIRSRHLKILNEHIQEIKGGD